MTVTVINDYALNYLLEIPAEVPTGRVVVHNSARPTRKLGSRGFRVWLAVLLCAP